MGGIGSAPHFASQQSGKTQVSSGSISDDSLKAGRAPNGEMI
jgi:hypothetical protein